jgi:hypothetical protein
MKATVNGITRAALAAGIPEPVVERHIDGLITFALEMATRERNSAKRQIRKWYFDKALNKPRLFEILDDPEEDTI